MKEQGFGYNIVNGITRVMTIHEYNRLLDVPQDKPSLSFPVKGTYGFSGEIGTRYPVHRSPWLNDHSVKLEPFPDRLVGEAERGHITASTVRSQTDKPLDVQHIRIARYPDQDKITKISTYALTLAITKEGTVAPRVKSMQVCAE